MTLTLPQAREMAQGPLTDEQLRTISDAALLLVGWKSLAAFDANGDPRSRWFRPDGRELLSDYKPHPAADLTDAAKWMVPEDPANPGKPMLWSVAYDENGVGGERFFTAGVGKGYHDPEYIYGHSVVNPALALTLAGWAATLEQKG